jgi:hypothetical protein
MPKYYFYKLTHDNGGAPCIEDDLLSLAICKPMIRRTADEHDIIIGFAANSLHADNRVIYVAKVWKRLREGEYFKNPEYRNRADCIYSYRGSNYHVRSNARYHGSVRDLHHDLGKPPNYTRANVLLSKDFCYFGAAGSAAYKYKLPAVTDSIRRLKRGHRVSHSTKLLEELERLAETFCSLRGAQIAGAASEKPSRGVCLRGSGCGIAAPK